MKSLLFVLLGVSLTVTCWGVYGPILHKGQARLFTTAGGQTNDRLKPLICVGLSYFVVAIIVPIVILGGRGELTEGWSMGGITWSMLAGTAGALGALGIILALSSGGKPIYVMPLVFGCAPVIAVALSVLWGKDMDKPSPIFYAGLILVAAGAATVLVFQPKSHAHPPANESPPAAKDSPPEVNAGEEAADDQPEG